MFLGCSLLVPGICLLSFPPPTPNTPAPTVALYTIDAGRIVKVTTALRTWLNAPSRVGMIPLSQEPGQDAREVDDQDGRGEKENLSQQRPDETPGDLPDDNVADF